ncbi:MAG: hypothetical protein RG741_01865 [Bacteroidales bacterium]|nr:hypothetical protein [Bacteroidales bacterium]
MRTKTFLIFPALALLLYSCADYDALQDIEIEPFTTSFVLPLINSEATIAEMIDAGTTDLSSFLEVTDDRLIMKFDNELSIRPFLFIPERRFEQTIPIQAAAFEITIEEEFSGFGTGSELKHLFLSRGQLLVEFEKDFADDVEIKITFPGMIYNGRPVSITAEWGENPFLSSNIVDLADTRLDLFRVEGTDTLYNNITYHIEFESATADAGSFNTFIRFGALRYEKAVGFIENAGELGDNEINFGLFEAIIEDPYIYLEDIFIEFDIGTSLGVPLALLIGHMYLVNHDEDTLNIQNTGAAAGIDDHWKDFLLGEMNYPAYATEEEGFVRTRFRLNNDNSNINDLLSFIPVSMGFTGGYYLGEINPATPVEYIHDFFVADTSRVHFVTKVEMPLTGSILDLFFDFEREVGSYPELGFVEDFTASMVVETKNGIPVSLGMQLIFVDSEGAELVRIFDDVASLIESPEIDDSGDAIGYREQTMIYSLTREQYDKMLDAAEMRVLFKAQTKGARDRSVNIRPSDFLGIKATLYIDATVAP